MKVFNVAIFGGEPLMRKDFFTILDDLHKRGLRGLLIKEKEIQEGKGMLNKEL